jgi:hypothetical protein
MQPGKWADKWVVAGIAIGTDETDLLQIRATRASEVDIQIDDSITPGTQIITVKIYGSCDNGVNWFLLYFYDATANRWVAASAINSNPQAGGSVVLYTTDNTHDLLKVTGARAVADEGLVTITVREKVAL